MMVMTDRCTVWKTPFGRNRLEDTALIVYPCTYMGGRAESPDRTPDGRRGGGAIRHAGGGSGGTFAWRHGRNRTLRAHELLRC